MSTSSITPSQTNPISHPVSLDISDTDSRVQSILQTIWNVTGSFPFVLFPPLLVGLAVGGVVVTLGGAPLVVVNTILGALGGWLPSQATAIVPKYNEEYKRQVFQLLKENIQNKFPQSDYFDIDKPAIKQCGTTEQFKNQLEDYLTKYEALHYELSTMKQLMKDSDFGISFYERHLKTLRQRVHSLRTTKTHEGSAWSLKYDIKDSTGELDKLYNFASSLMQKNPNQTATKRTQNEIVCSVAMSAIKETLLALTIDFSAVLIGSVVFISLISIGISLIPTTPIIVVVVALGVALVATLLLSKIGKNHFIGSQT